MRLNPPFLAAPFEDSDIIPNSIPRHIHQSRMTDLSLLKTCELHVHTGGCIYAEDLLDLGREIYDRVDWHLYIDTYEKAFGIRPDPVALFADALSGEDEGLERLRRHFVVGEEDAGDFGRFQAKFNMAICLYRYWYQILGREEEIVRRILERHRAEGLHYVEYRAMAPYDADDPENFAAFHGADEIEWLS